MPKGAGEEKCMPNKRVASCTLDPHSTKPVPIEYAGKWVAWASDHSQIVADSDSIERLWQIVQERCILNPIFEKVPRSDVRFVGLR